MIQPALLALLAEEPTHGYRLVQRLGRMTVFEGHRPDTTGVYRFLRAMERRRLVSSAWDLRGRGPARRLYGLTARGRKCLALWRSTLAGYHDQIGRLLGVVRAACRSTKRTALPCRSKARTAGGARRRKP